MRKYFIFLILSLSVCIARAAKPLYVYEGGGLTVRVMAVSDDETTVSGEIVRDGKTFPFTGKSSARDESIITKGTFGSGNDQQDFTATQREGSEGQLTF